MNNIFQLYNALINNPMSLLQGRYNIPQDIDTQNPDAIIQHLLNTGQISQGQINQVMQMRNNPMIQMLMRGR